MNTMRTDTIIAVFLATLLMACLLIPGCTMNAGTTSPGMAHDSMQPATEPAVVESGTIPAAPPGSVSPAGSSPSVPASPLLGRPTDHSVTISLLPTGTFTGFIEYHNSSMGTATRTTVAEQKAGVPVNIVLNDLAPDTEYRYRICTGSFGSAAGSCNQEYRFHTGRPAGSSFVFDIQADSHLDDRASGDLYSQAIRNEMNDSPDFLIDLGDTSMTEKLPLKSADAIRSRYLLQRSYLDAVGSSAPLFLVLGNHDGEAGYEYDGTAGSLAAISLQFRKQFFPNPEPDGFYTGNEETLQSLGHPEDYYSWQWGDALFVVIDPFWYTTTRPGGKSDGWAWTLGRTQYDWLRQTLNTSKARYKFVFSHHLVGGDLQGRGGVENAGLYEWGGMNPDGTPGFDQHRPGWGVPIREILAATNVSAFFHGHDHLFARQELDGIVYQEVPQPATPGTRNPGAEYGYANGVILPSPGHLRVTVGPDSAQVDYIRSALPGNRKDGTKNGEVVYSYTIMPA